LTLSDLMISRFSFQKKVAKKNQRKCKTRIKQKRNNLMQRVKVEDTPSKTKKKRKKD